MELSEAFAQTYDPAKHYWPARPETRCRMCDASLPPRPRYGHHGRPRLYCDSSRCHREGQKLDATQRAIDDLARRLIPLIAERLEWIRGEGFRLQVVIEEALYELGENRPEAASQRLKAVHGAARGLEMEASDLFWIVVTRMLPDPDDPRFKVRSPEPDDTPTDDWI